MSPFYLYGITSFNSHEHPRLRSQIFGPVQHLAYKDISALVSSTEEEYVKATIEAAGDHERILNEIHRYGATLPIEFGTLAPSQDAVLDLLKRNYHAIRRSLKRLHEKCQMNVMAFWANLSILLNEIARENRDIRIFKEEIQKRNKPATYEEQVRIGQWIAEARQAKEETERERLIRELSRASLDHAHDRIWGENMFMNTAFLVKSKTVNRFESQLLELGHRYESWVDFKYQGPMPPYHFVNLSLEVAS